MRLSIPSVELYVVLVLSKSREHSTPGFLPGNNLPRIFLTTFFFGNNEHEFETLLYLDKSRYIQPRLLL